MLIVAIKIWAIIAVMMTVFMFAALITGNRYDHRDIS